MSYQAKFWQPETTVKGIRKIQEICISNERLNITLRMNSTKDKYYFHKSSFLIIFGERNMTSFCISLPNKCFQYVHVIQLDLFYLLPNISDTSTNTSNTICAYPLDIDRIRFGPQLTLQEGSYLHSIMEEQHMPDGQPSRY